MTLVSLFAGIGGFDLGFQRAGVKTVATVEIDPNCRKLLKEKWPDAIHTEDVRFAGAKETTLQRALKVKRAMTNEWYEKRIKKPNTKPPTTKEALKIARKHTLPRCDIITYGFPCQDLSTAGKRAGLAGERSGLFYEGSRIINELKPTFTLFENVPGLLSSDCGRDFARVLVELDDIGYHGAWRVLDAQWLGVAQRRRRVFGLFARVGAGDRAGGREILPDAGSDQGDFTESREIQKNSAAGAGDGVAGIRWGDTGVAGWCAQVLGIPTSLQGHPPPERRKAPPITHNVAPCLRAGGAGTARAGQSHGQDAVIAVQDVVHGDKACNGKGWQDDGSAYTLDTLATQGVCLPGVAGTLDRKSCSANRSGQSNETDFLVPEVVGTLDRECGGTKLQVQYAASGHLLPVACRKTAFGEYTEDGTAPTISARDHKSATDLIAFDMAHADGPVRLTGRKVNTLLSRMGTGGNQVPCVAHNVARTMRVRRLTPVECERLQGFPDSWTAGFSDSVRYRMLGNAVCVNVAEWIAKRLVKVVESEWRTTKDAVELFCETASKRQGEEL